MSESKFMSKKILGIMLLIVVVAALLTAGYFLIFKDKGSLTSEGEIYTCPMHPQIVQDRPGTCPICGMDLVLKSKMDSQSDEHSEHDISDLELGTVKLSPSQLVLANVQTERVRLMQFSGEKTFNGIVKMNEKSFSVISSAIGGKITKMYIDFEGETVRKGQPVFEIFSPDLIAAQKEFLLALDNYEKLNQSNNSLAIEQAKSLFESSRYKLTRWEMKPNQIDELETNRRIMNTVKIYSSFSGIVTKRLATPGKWIMEGESIYEVANLSTVWVIANIYESDVKLIKNGQIVEIISSAHPDEPIMAKINFIEPVINPETRTLEVRMEVQNKNFRLKPNMYVKIKISTYRDQLLAVPKNSVIRTGEQDIVYIEKQKGVYVPREVKVQFEQDGYYAISSGIEEGDIVVASGGFLIDSESQIQSGITTSGHEQHTGSNQKKDEDFKINKDQNIMKDMEKNTSNNR
jgi:Cu(I)/Ag(I) efflux system membrane fusion protein